MKGDSCTQRETGMLLTPKSPELDIMTKAQRPGGE